jgi:hypothetical protein
MTEANQPPTERLDELKFHGFQPGEAQAFLSKGAKPGVAVTTPKQTSVILRDLFTPPVPGRKVVLLGDTCDSRAIVGTLPPGTTTVPSHHRQCSWGMLVEQADQPFNIE